MMMKENIYRPTCLLFDHYTQFFYIKLVIFLITSENSKKRKTTHLKYRSTDDSITRLS